MKTENATESWEILGIRWMGFGTATVTFALGVSQVEIFEEGLKAKVTHDRPVDLPGPAVFDIISVDLSSTRLRLTRK